MSHKSIARQEESQHWPLVKIKDKSTRRTQSNGESLVKRGEIGDKCDEKETKVSKA